MEDSRMKDVGLEIQQFETDEKMIKSRLMQSMARDLRIHGEIPAWALEIADTLIRAGWRKNEV